MNKFGNTRAAETKDKIKKSLLYLLKHKDFNQIYVKDICSTAGINRSSFYSHYQDINDLMVKTESELAKSISEIFNNIPNHNKETFTKMFEFVKDNAEFYSVFLSHHDCSIMAESDFKNYQKKLEHNTLINSNFPSNEIVYHMAFFAAGLQSICRLWLSKGMKETPEQLADIIYREYINRPNFV